MLKLFLFLSVLFLVSGCTEQPPEWSARKDALFQKLSSRETGIVFENALHAREDFDVFRYRNFYNGAGVGIGDFNNDGYSDVFLTANMGDNKLFLNKGNWKFEDITEKAGVKGSKIWSTGVSIADVNGDGLLDIYVCNAGDVNGNNQENELFINNGNLTFTEKAKEFGLADRGFSTHAAFFDYDKDGDIDCYVLNNSYRPVSTLGYRNLRNERDELGGHKLYRNDNNHFVDVSEYAGIFGSVIGFGLGVTVGDVNQDNWPDLYVSNDFYERDYLYINNRDGTFSEKLESYLGHISMFSMGADLADLNNDGYPEIFSTDMLPKKDERLKTLTAFETYDVYQLRLKNGYYHQFVRNMLHRNNRDGTFSEIGTLAGVQATDWSWGAIIADFNNDLYKEIYVCNGIYKDLTNQDFVEYLGSSEQMRAAIEGKKIDFGEFVNGMPSVKLSNYMFTRKNEWQYENVAAEWGLDEPGFSNGAAYGDLDNDGDLDLVVNNVNQELFVYKNRSREQNGNHFLALTFKGTPKNAFGLGASIKAYVGKEMVALDNMPIRGYQSSMDYKMIVGLGPNAMSDSLIITWPDNKKEVRYKVPADQTLKIDHANAQNFTDHSKAEEPDPLFQPPVAPGIEHHENEFNEFDRDRLLYHMLSTQGPAFATADLNHDGRDDLYVGGSLGSPGKIYLQISGNRFSPLLNFPADSLSDDVSAVFFDADGDKDLDLYVVTGGTEHLSQSAALQDKFYINRGIKNGAPVFTRESQPIPALYQSGSCVRAADVDNDGDVDLFIGTRVIPSYYGLPCDQFLLLNDGRGIFTDVTATWTQQFKGLGMVTDAAWNDYDGDGWVDLIMVGDWMPVTIFKNNGKQLNKVTPPGIENSEGWWNRINPADIDMDGDTDFVLGNLGLNSKFTPSPEQPVKLYVNDFDKNGSFESIFAFSDGAHEYPFVLRQDLLKQMSSLKKKFIYSRDYAGKTMPDIFDQNLLEQATKLTFHTASTSVLINRGSDGFYLKALPLEAQVSPVYGIETGDFNKDGHPDIIVGGNLFSVKPEVGRYDALMGLVLLGNGKGDFMPLPGQESGISIQGEIRHISLIRNKNNQSLVIVRNNDSLLLYEIKE